MVLLAPPAGQLVVSGDGGAVGFVRGQRLAPALAVSPSGRK